MTPKVVMGTQRQLWAHLLCRECEARLNKFGETPVLKLLDTGSGFRLLERMHLALELKIESNTVSFSGSAMGVDTDALAYFALGILWKGSVNKWSTVEGQTTSISLGAFEEPIRKYLLGEGGFPPDVYVLVGACEDRGSRGMVFAPSLVGGVRHRMFSILVRGIWFHVITDKNALPGIKKLCCVQSEKRVLHLEDCSQRFLQAGRHIHRTARIAPNVR